MSIVINEVDNTLYGNSSADTDNYVFIPGSAITGRYDEPVELTNYNDFVKNFGDHGCEGSITWDYVANILLAGFPVLFQRIGSKNNVDLVKKARLEIKNAEETDTILIFEEKYGGTYGNSLSVSLTIEYETVYLRLYYKTKIIETYKICTTSDITASDDETDKNVAELSKRIAKGLKEVSSGRITVTVPDDSKFVFLNGITKQALSGGKDADENEVLEVISEQDPQLSVFEKLTDKYIYDIKYIVSGGYIDTDLNIAKNMIDLAEERQDCIAIPDMPLNIDKNVANRYFNTLNTSYGAAFAPWCYVELKTNGKEKKWMPPSFVFLYRLALSVVKNGNPLWYPVAGVKRASVSFVNDVEYTIGEGLIDDWQSMSQQSLNPIVKLRTYGYVIYGQRTLYNSDDSNYPSPSALRLLSVRITANEIKRAIYNIALGLKHEKNDRYTWNEFKSLLEPLLKQMKNDRGITDYRITMNEVTTTEEDIQEYRINGLVEVSVLNSVEDFVIGFNLEPSSVTFEETTDSLLLDTNY